jgi:hypothetical protein
MPYRRGSRPQLLSGLDRDLRGPFRSFRTSGAMPQPEYGPPSGLRPRSGIPAGHDSHARDRPFWKVFLLERCSRKVKPQKTRSLKPLFQHRGHDLLWGIHISP